MIEGIKTLIERRYEETTSAWSKDWYASFMAEHTCPTCQGRRLNDQVLSVRVGDLNISEFTDMSIEKALLFVEELKLNETEAKIAKLILKENMYLLIYFVFVLNRYTCNTQRLIIL